jgi:hypothetical protein
MRRSRRGVSRADQATWTLVCLDQERNLVVAGRVYQGQPGTETGTDSEPNTVTAQLFPSIPVITRRIAYLRAGRSANGVTARQKGTACYRWSTVELGVA